MRSSAQPRKDALAKRPAFLDQFGGFLKVCAVLIGQMLNVLHNAYHKLRYVALSRGVTLPPAFQLHNRARAHLFAVHPLGVMLDNAERLPSDRRHFRNGASGL